MSRRVCFSLDLVNDAELIAAYDHAHAPGMVWADVIEGIRAKGFEDMEIWRVDSRLFMIAEVSDTWPQLLDAEKAEIDARWEREMDKFQRPISGALPGEKWRPMQRIFALEEQ